jgi:glycosyltransferase involved in cell wall biosynthesis
MGKERHPILYVLHSSNLYGTERMALATAQGLSDDFETIFLGPYGPFLPLASTLGFETHRYRTSKDLAGILNGLLPRFPALTFVGTGPRYNLVCMMVNMRHRRRIKQIQMVHGGAGEKKDYARKKVLNFFDVTFVVVSEWCRQKLIEYGVTNRIEVVGNFLLPEQVAQHPARPTYQQPGIRKAVMVSRVDEVKRIDLLLDALDLAKEKLSDVQFRVLGVGPKLEEMRERARRSNPNVEFVGFCEDVASELAESDLLVHTCGIEAFGMAVLEAMTARLVSLVPDAGGAVMLADHGKCGFTFRADDASDLAARLVELKDVSAEVLNELAARAAIRVASEYSAGESLAKYRKIFALE